MEQVGILLALGRSVELIRYIIGANSEVKRRRRCSTAVVRMKESMASLWCSSTNEHQRNWSHHQWFEQGTSPPWVKTLPEFFHLLIWRTGYWNPENIMKHFEFSRKKLSPSYILWVKEYLLFGRNAYGTRLTPDFAPSTSNSDVFWEGSNLKHPHRCSESWK